MNPAGIGRRQAVALAAGAIALAAFGFVAYNQIGAMPSSTPPPHVPPSPLVGVVVFVDEESINEINSFDLLLPDGSKYTLLMGPLDDALQFSPSHLAVHLATGVPIRAAYRLENGQPVVYHLEDAVTVTPAPSGSGGVPGATGAPPGVTGAPTSAAGAAAAP